MAEQTEFDEKKPTGYTWSMDMKTPKIRRRQAHGCEVIQDVGQPNVRGVTVHGSLGTARFSLQRTVTADAKEVDAQADMVAASMAMLAATVTWSLAGQITMQSAALRAQAEAAETPDAETQTPS